MMDRETLYMLRNTIVQPVEHAILTDRWNEGLRTNITPYLLLHMLDTLERIEKELTDMGAMAAQQWGYTKEEDVHE